MVEHQTMILNVMGSSPVLAASLTRIRSASKAQLGTTAGNGYEDRPL